MSAPDATLKLALEHAFGGAVPGKIGVAVSGGGDSMALLDLLRRRGGTTLCVASVNHGFREEADDEIALVAEYAARHGLSHDVLRWHWDGVGNLQAAARDGRRGALRDWAIAKGIEYVALGHTADDQAETFLMRLARGSGVDGLSGMTAVRPDGPVTWCRPLLTVRRDDLRRHLREVGVKWADDPSNEDSRFDRVKARQMMETLTPLGLSVARLVQTAEHMAQEKDVLVWAASQAKAQAAKVVAGDVVLERSALANMPKALAFRILADALCFVSGDTYRPRFKALKAAWSSDRDTSLHGCLILHRGGGVNITRELNAVQKIVVPLGMLWDGRWQVTGDGFGAGEGYDVAALGEGGLSQCPEWRATGMARQTLLASPAVWREGALIAAPLVGFGKGWYARLADGRDRFD